MEQDFLLLSMAVCKIWSCVWIFLNFRKRQNLDSSKLKEFADDNFEFDVYGR